MILSLPAMSESFLKDMLCVQDELRKQAGKEKAALTLSVPHAGLKEKISQMYLGRLNASYELSDTAQKEKLRKEILLDLLKEDLQERLPQGSALADDGQKRMVVLFSQCHGFKNEMQAVFGSS